VGRRRFLPNSITTSSLWPSKSRQSVSIRFRPIGTPITSPPRCWRNSAASISTRGLQRNSQRCRTSSPGRGRVCGSPPYRCCCRKVRSGALKALAVDVAATLPAGTRHSDWPEAGLAELQIALDLRNGYRRRLGPSSRASMRKSPKLWAVPEVRELRQAGHRVATARMPADFLRAKPRVSGLNFSRARRVSPRIAGKQKLKAGGRLPMSLKPDGDGRPSRAFGGVGLNFHPSDFKRGHIAARLYNRLPPTRLDRALRAHPFLGMSHGAAHPCPCKLFSMSSFRRCGRDQRGAVSGGRPKAGEGIFYRSTIPSGVQKSSRWWKKRSAGSR